MSQKAYLWILKIGVILSFICVFFVFRGLLFPYITSKQIPFNILTEILLVIWLAFIIKFPQWNPFKGYRLSWPFNLFGAKKEIVAPVAEVVQDNRRQKKNSTPADAPLPPTPVPQNLITFALIAFFAVLIISCFTGVDFHMSFWSNAERMLGVFHILHFFILYLIMITVLRDWWSWQLTIGALVLAATGVALNSMKPGGMNYSSLGNTLYASGFMMFAFFFVMILFFHRDSGEPKKNELTFLKWFWFLTIPFLFILFHRADNTGEYVGFGAGVIAFVFLLGVVNKRQLVRWVSLLIAALLIGGFVFVFTHHNEPWIAQSKILREMNTGKNTFQTRLISWRGAAKDFHNHWLLGTGFGNYAIIFDKYFTADFFNYSQSETYFDRAHNNIVDLASTTGALGLAAYLSIFVGVGIYLIKALRRRRIRPLEFCIISGLFVAYFVQNLGVFDSFVTYICLMILLGYVNWLANTDQDRGNERALLAAGGPSGFANKEIYALLGFGLIVAFSIYNYAILPLQTLTGVIQGQIAFNDGDVYNATKIFEQALAHNTPIDKDGRSMFLRSVADDAWEISKLDAAKADEITSFAIKEGEANVKYNSHDSLMQLELSRVYDAAMRTTSDADKKNLYGQEALTHVDLSLAASPERVPVYFVKAQFLLGQNRLDDAIAVLEQAAALSKTFTDTYCQLGQLYLVKGNTLNEQKATSAAATFMTQGWQAMDQCLTGGGADNLAVEDIVKQAINHYSEKKDADKVLMLYEQLVKFESNNTQFLIFLAQLYEKHGDLEKAKQTALQAAQVDPKLQADVQDYIQGLDSQQK
ncbi:MAG TPA: O-antigen ligase family protein [Candidatus Methylomirabilis sp.]|nr:O-antigen ligase family protein [Candidatus Methylomirabilis sp.]